MKTPSERDYHDSYWEQFGAMLLLSFFFGLAGYVFGNNLATADPTIPQYIIGTLLVLIALILGFRAGTQKPILKDLNPNLPIWKIGLITFILVLLVHASMADDEIWDWIKSLNMN